MALTPSNPGQVSPPNDLTEQGTGSVAIPNDLTEQSAGSVAIPNNLTEQSAGSVAIPNNLTEQSVGSVAIPNNLTEQSAGSVAIPNDLTEQSAGSVAIPNNLTEQAVGTIPRTLDPILKLDFENEVYETTSNQGLDDIVTYSRNSSASFWNRRQDEQGRWETFLDTDYVGSVENLLTYSENFVESESNWVDENGAVTTATNETFNGSPVFKITSTATGTFPQTRQDVSESGDLTFEFYVKDVNSGSCAIRINGTDVVSSGQGSLTYEFYFANQEFVLRSGVDGGDINASYQGDGWYKIVMSITCTTATRVLIYQSYNSTNTNSILATKAQLTQSLKSLPYVVTTTTSASDTFVESPRLEYDPITAEPLGYLAEGASTNFLLRSEEIDSASWSKARTTTDPNSYIALDGTKSADAVLETTDNNTHYVSQNYAGITSGLTYTASVYVKPIGDRDLFIQFFSSGGAFPAGSSAIYNLSTSEVTSTGAGIDTATITSVGNGWYRATLTITAIGTSSGAVQIFSYNGATSFAGDTSSGLVVWGAMLEELPFSSSYIRTEGATVQRNGDDMQAYPFSPTLYEGSFRAIFDLSKFGVPTGGTGVSRNIFYDGNADIRLYISALDTMVFNYGQTGRTVYSFNEIPDSNEITATKLGTDLTLYKQKVFDTNYTSGGEPTTIGWVDIGLAGNNSFLYGHISLIEFYEQELTASEVALGDSLSGITEAVIPALSAPNNLTEQSVGAVAIPNDLTEQAVSAFPRTFAPLLNLDFANEIYATNDEPSALDDIVTYTRNSSASFWNRRLNRNGKYETFIDTDYVGTVTNLIEYSEGFDQSEWTKGGCTVQQINGEIFDNAYRITESNLSETHQIFNPYDFTSGTQITFSIYVKAETRKALRITFGAAGFGSAQSANFDIVNGEFGVVTSNNEAMIQYISDDWYRLSFTATPTATATANIQVILLETNTSSSVYQGDGNSSTLVYGAQLVEDAKALPYVATTTGGQSETFVETPRLEYDPITAEPLGFLSEGSSTNLQIWSEEFDNAVYTKTGGAITANDTVAPDGTKSADLFTIDSSTGSHSLADAITFTDTESYTFSIFVKWNPSNTINQLRLLAGNAGILPLDIRVNFSTLTVIETSGTGKITDCGGGWYRIEASDTAVSTGLTNINLNMFDGASNSFTGNGTDSFHLWGWQVENLPFASSYIATLSGSTVQRVQENLQLSSGIINEARQSITLSAEARQSFLPDRQRFIMSINMDDTAQSFLTTTTGNQFRHRHGENASSSNFVLTQNNVDQFYKSALTFNGSESRLFVNGDFDISIADSGGDVTLSNIGIKIGTNDGSSNSSHWYGNIKSVRIYDETLTDQEVSLL